MNRYVTALALVLVVVGAPASAQETPVLAAEDQELIAWLGRAGVPDLSGRPFVLVSTGAWSQTDGEAPRATRWHAFLLREDEARFTVLGPDLVEATFERRAGAPHEAVGYEAADLDRVVGERLTTLRAADPAAHRWRDHGRYLDEPAELVGLARACVQNGRSGLAADLFEQARRLRSWRSGPFPARVREAVADAAWRHLLVRIAGTRDRAAAARECEAMAGGVFAGTSREAWARASAGVLARMAEEEQAPPPDDAARALVRGLRDVSAGSMNPGGVYLYFAPDQPDGRLLALGFDAVPALLEALEDRRFTRALFYSRIGEPDGLLTVGYVASMILSELAGRPLWTPDEAAAWWAEVGPLGQVEALARVVAAGDDAAPAQARRLAARDPARALTAIEAALASADDWVQEELLQIAAGLDLPGATALLERALAGGPTLARAAAARALHGRAHPDAERVAAELWRGWRVPADQVTWLEPETGHEACVLVDLLATIGTPAAIEALRADLAARHVDVRTLVVSALLPRGDEGWGASGGYFSGAVASLSDPLAAREAQALLHEALEDDEDTSMTFRLGRVSVRSARVCDVAALAIARRWSEVEFDPTAPLAARDAQRLRMIDRWREATGLPPQARADASGERDFVRRVVVSGVDAPDLAERCRALEGRSFTPATVPDLLRAVVERTPWGAVGIHVRALRRGHQAGVELAVELLPCAPRAPGAQRFWKRQYVVSGGASPERFESNGGVDADQLEHGDHLDLAALQSAIERALAGPPEARFDARARLVAEPP